MVQLKQIIVPTVSEDDIEILHLSEKDNLLNKYIAASGITHSVLDSKVENNNIPTKEDNTLEIDDNDAMKLRESSTDDTTETDDNSTVSEDDIEILHLSEKDNLLNKYIAASGITHSVLDSKVENNNIPTKEDNTSEIDDNDAMKLRESSTDDTTETDNSSSTRQLDSIITNSQDSGVMSSVTLANNTTEPSRVNNWYTVDEVLLLMFDFIMEWCEVI